MPLCEALNVSCKYLGQIHNMAYAEGIRTHESMNLAWLEMYLTIAAGEHL